MGNRIKWISSQMKVRNLEGAFTILSNQNPIFDKLLKYHLCWCLSLTILYLNFEKYMTILILLKNMNYNKLSPSSLLSLKCWFSIWFLTQAAWYWKSKELKQVAEVEWNPQESQGNVVWEQGLNIVTLRFHSSILTSRLSHIN